MAIVILGKTTCLLCGKPLLQGQKTVQLSPFVANEADPIWKFSDGAFHEECFRRDPLADMAERRYREFKEHETSAHRRCHVCGKPLLSPNDYIPFGYLTDDPSHALYRLNYAAFHRSCLPSWSEIGSVYELATAQMRSGAWKGRGMQWLVDTLKDAQANKSRMVKKLDREIQRG
jgi:hypothetical protein